MSDVRLIVIDDNCGVGGGPSVWAIGIVVVQGRLHYYNQVA
jgi:hypothetical protein